MTIPAAVLSGIVKLQLEVAAAYPVAQTTAYALALLQADANTLVLATTGALAADDVGINAASLDAEIAADLALGDLADVAADLVEAVALILEDNALANLQALAQRIQTNLYNVGA